MKRRSNRADVVSTFASILLVLGIVTVSTAQTFKTLLNFNGADGAMPINVTLVQGADGDLYGTTDYGGVFGYGTVFKLTPAGKLTTLYSFCRQGNCIDGANPAAGLAHGKDGNFYGVTVEGGVANAGTIFKITPEGVLTTLHSFEGANGAFPEYALVQANNGNFYGTASAGGNTNLCPGIDGGCGTIFQITSSGTFTLLHSFDLTDGATPQGALIQAADGDLYGNTFQGDTAGVGTIFKVTLTGELTTLHRFNGRDGAHPSGALVELSKGTFYGTTGFGGRNGDGTVFKVTSTGTLKTLHSFDITDGYVPNGALIRGADGNLYGTTASGGGNGALGTIFKITLAGSLTTLHRFCAPPHCADGAEPFGGLFQADSGIFFGTAYGGGTNLDGTIFTMSVP